MRLKEADVKPELPCSAALLAAALIDCAVAAMY